jgi:bifunctional DNA-binding transcriptional regulator/antitoxin component of YhaV-PrlF toxin-antitoxin module
MATVAALHVQQHEPANGSVMVDSSGRVLLPKAIREALHLEAGATLHYQILGGAIWFTPSDEKRAAWNSHHVPIQAGSNAVGEEEVDPTLQAMLDALPAIRDQVAREIYGNAFIDELTQRHAAILAAHHDPASVP